MGAFHSVIKRVLNLISVGIHKCILAEVTRMSQQDKKVTPRDTQAVHHDLQKFTCSGKNMHLSPRGMMHEEPGKIDTKKENFCFFYCQPQVNLGTKLLKTGSECHPLIHLLCITVNIGPIRCPTRFQNLMQLLFNNLSWHNELAMSSTRQMPLAPSLRDVF